jgi:hypothetical protein
VRLEIAIALIGVIPGLLIGRWWALLLAVPFGIWFATLDWGFVFENSDSGGPYWGIGAIAGLLFAGGIAVGVIIRRKRDWRSFFRDEG